MNYIELLNRFWRYLQSDALTPTAQLLYYTLLQINNQCGWAEWFQRTNASLAATMKVSERSLIIARNLLKQKGLIDFKVSKRRGECTKYTLCTVQNAVQSAVQSAVQNAVQSADINKTKNKTKNNNPPTPLDCLIDAYTKSEGLREALRKFVAMRARIQRPCSEDALEIIMAQLDEMYVSDADKIKCVNQSVGYSWQGLVRLDATKRRDYPERNYSEDDLSALVDNDLDDIVM